MKDKESEAWWSELKSYEELSKNFKWCCKLVLEGGFEQRVLNELGHQLGLRFNLNYCPHCGTQLAEIPPKMFSRGCCFIFRDLGLEAFSFEETTVDEFGKEETNIHRLFMKHCIQCGGKLEDTFKQVDDNDSQHWSNNDNRCNGCGDCH